MDGRDPDRRDGGKLSRTRLRKRTGCHGNQTDGSASFYCAMIIINNQNLKEKSLNLETSEEITFNQAKKGPPGPTCQPRPHSPSPKSSSESGHGCMCDARSCSQDTPAAARHVALTTKRVKCCKGVQRGLRVAVHHCSAAGPEVKGQTNISSTNKLTHKLSWRVKRPSNFISSVNKQ